MNQLVCFFSENAEGKRLVGVGLTDKMIEHLKDKGAILEEGERTGQDTDIVLVYGSDMTALVRKTKALFPAHKTEIRVL